MGRSIKPDERHVLTVEVRATKAISPTFVRVTVGGPALEQFAYMGYDQWFRTFIPKEGQAGLRLPPTTSPLWFAQWMLMSKDSRPLGRNYTVRDFRENGVFGPGRELDIDFAIHSGGEASDWAENAQVGDRIGILDEGITYNPTADADWHLLVGDENALPAIVGILQSAARDLQAEAFIEIPHADDAQEIDAPAGANVHWLVRTDRAAKPGALALETVQAAQLRDGRMYAFVAGEQKLASGIRRHWSTTVKVPKHDVTFTGYWR